MDFIYPDWPAQANIRAFTSKRTKGLSHAPYHSNNLALHVGDEEKTVIANRNILAVSQSLPNTPQWLDQHHGNTCILIDNIVASQKTSPIYADASVTRIPNTVLAIMTADCLPILICNQKGDEVAAIHAGFKGLINGIIENTIQTIKSKPEELLIFMAPCICQACYEVDAAVYEPCMQRYPYADEAFKRQGNRYLFSLTVLATRILNTLSVKQIYFSNKCTFEENSDFFSYRRAQQTGRMASLIWFNTL